MIGMSRKQSPHSYKDPDGFIYSSDSILYRQVNLSYKADYDQLMDSGLYRTLTDKQLLIPHHEKKFNRNTNPAAYKILQPEKLSFVSYPYEWTFSQLKDAALLTLEVQQRAFEKGMTLKDASFFNIQFENSRPLFIDTLSFTKYIPDQPWIPYRQFCKHFLGPIALMSYRDIRLGRLLQTYIDGLPLDLVHQLLPITSNVSLSLLLHIHLHARTAKQAHSASQAIQSKPFSKVSHEQLIEHLKTAVEKLTLKENKSRWSNYYRDNSYTKRAFDHKQQLVAMWLAKVKPRSVWDLGANQGVFSRLATEQSIFTVAFDSDYAASEANYLAAKKEKNRYLLPLVMDLTNPSPALGFGHEERYSLIERGPADLVMALALLHHMAIGNNLPLMRIAQFLRSISIHLILEFVPKADPMVKQMLANRRDIFDEYEPHAFEQAFSPFFSILAKQQLIGSKRLLYFLKSKKT
jgi:ribosomal protein L11 methylase PrmA